MCVSLRTSTKQIQIISGRNKLSSYLTLSFSCRFVMLKKKWLEHFACKFCRQSTPVASRATQRRPGAEINTPLRWGIVTEYQKLLGERSRVLDGGLKSLQSLFPWNNQVSSANTSSRNSCRKHLHRSVQFALISLAFVHDVAADESRSQKR